MAKRSRNVECYVYRIFDGFETVYIGKGSGRRLKAQQRNFGLQGEIIEKCSSDEHAFERERYWIAQLKPSENISPGGSGGRAKPKPLPRKTDVERGIEQYGSRRYTAMMLVAKLAEHNCERWGVSITDLARLRMVAAGG